MKKPQSERAVRRRTLAAERKANAPTCASHAAPIQYGIAGGWHRFRCGCEPRNGSGGVLS